MAPGPGPRFAAQRAWLATLQRTWPILLQWLVFLALVWLCAGFSAQPEEARETGFSFEEAQAKTESAAKGMWARVCLGPKLSAMVGLAYVRRATDDKDGLRKFETPRENAQGKQEY